MPRIFLWDFGGNFLFFFVVELYNILLIKKLKIFLFFKKRLAKMLLIVHNVLRVLIHFREIKASFAVI